jgi:hypothetical protein
MFTIHMIMNRPSRRKHHFIYRTTCLVTDKYYVGMHSTDDVDDGYMGSGRILERSIKKHGLDKHVRYIVEVCDDRAALAEREKEIVNVKMLRDPLCMNLVEGGNGGAQPGERNSFFGKHHKRSTIEKIRASMSGEKGPCYGRTGVLHPQFGKKHTKDASRKMTLAHLGKPLTKEHVNAIRQGHSKRNADKLQRNAIIVDMVARQGLSRPEVAKLLGVHINIVYGAMHRHRKSVSS